jgi:hypothetical protein
MSSTGFCAGSTVGVSVGFMVGRYVACVGNDVGLADLGVV